MEKSSTVSLPKPGHIYEIDLIRAVTVFSVVAVHTISSMTFLVANSEISFRFINLIIHLLHYNREMFMFVTGLVLAYVYFNKSFSTIHFWSKRLLVVFIPYILWTIIYTKIGNQSLNYSAFLSLTGVNILTGNASYQLYYILLTLQFYLIFPFFRWFMKKIISFPGIILIVSFLLQILFLYLDYQYIQTGKIQMYGFVQTLFFYQDRIFLTYSFFFIFGTVVGVYLNQLYLIYKKWGKYLPLLFIITLLGYIFFYYYQENRLHESISYVISVLQPSVAIYSLVFILFITWLATIWVRSKKALRIIKVISDTSFGIFFVHVIFLTLYIQYILPVLPSEFPVTIKIITILGFVFTSSVLFCYLLLKVTFLSWTIGRIKK